MGARRGWPVFGLVMAREVVVDAAHRVAEFREVDVDALLGRAEDTSELLDYTVAEQQELLGTIWTAITDVAATRKRARMREGRLRRSADRLQRQAGQAAAAGRPEYARQAMAWRATILRHVVELTAEQATLRASEVRLSNIARRLQASIDACRIHRETIGAEYTAAQAVLGPGQLLSGNSSEPGPNGTGLTSGRIHTQLEAISRRSAVDQAMAQIRERRRTR